MEFIEILEETADHQIVRFNSFSTDERYSAIFYKVDNTVVCTCHAGKYGKKCKHKSLFEQLLGVREYDKLD